MNVSQIIIGLLMGLAISIAVIGPLILTTYYRYRRVIQIEVRARGGYLVRLRPSWILRRVVKGFQIGRRIRFEWKDDAEISHVSECEFLHDGVEGVGNGAFRWIGDVNTNGNVQ